MDKKRAPLRKGIPKKKRKKKITKKKSLKDVNWVSQPSLCVASEAKNPEQKAKIAPRGGSASARAPPRPAPSVRKLKGARRPTVVALPTRSEDGNDEDGVWLGRVTKRLQRISSNLDKALDASEKNTGKSDEEMESFLAYAEVREGMNAIMAKFPEATAQLFKITTGGREAEKGDMRHVLQAALPLQNLTLEFEKLAETTLGLFPESSSPVHSMYEFKFDVFKQYNKLLFDCACDVARNPRNAVGMQLFISYNKFFTFVAEWTRLPEKSSDSVDLTSQIDDQELDSLAEPLIEDAKKIVQAKTIEDLTYEVKIALLALREYAMFIFNRFSFLTNGNFLSELFLMIQLLFLKMQELIRDSEAVIEVGTSAKSKEAIKAAGKALDAVRFLIRQNRKFIGIMRSQSIAETHFFEVTGGLFLMIKEMKEGVDGGEADGEGDATGNSFLGGEPLLIEEVKTIADDLSKLYGAISSRVERVGSIAQSIQKKNEAVCTQALIYTQRLADDMPSFQQRVFQAVRILQHAASLLLSTCYVVSAISGNMQTFQQSFDQVSAKAVEREERYERFSENAKLNIEFTAVIRGYSDILFIVVDAVNRMSTANMAERIRDSDVEFMPVDWESVLSSSSYDVVYEKGNVTAATLEKLIHLLLTTKADSRDFVGTFILTSDSFTNPKELFQMLLQFYDCPGFPGDLPETVEKIRQSFIPRIAKFVVSWISANFFDMNKEVFDMTDTITSNLRRDGFEEEAGSISKAIEKKKMLNEKTRSRLLNRTTTIGKLNMQPSSVATTSWHLPSDFLLENAVKVAQQCCLVDMELFKLIQPHELLNQSWNKAKLFHRAPNVRSLLQRFNRIARWVATSILLPLTAQKRALFWSTFIDIGLKLKEYQNFNSSMAILAGLNHSSVYRLRKTKALLGKKYNEAFRDLTAFFSSDLSYKVYRSAWKEVKPPAIPFIGMFLTDLTFADDGNPDVVDGLINFWKREQVFSIISEISSFQVIGFEFEPDESFLSMLTVLSNISDEEMYRLSMLREPRQ